MKILFMKLIDILEIKKKINKAWFIYTHHAFVKDSDECAFDYLWKASSSNYIKFSLIILIFTLLF